MVACRAECPALLREGTPPGAQVRHAPENTVLFESVPQSGNATVTMELVFGCKWVQTEPREKSPATMHR